MLDVFSTDSLKQISLLETMGLSAGNDGIWDGVLAIYTDEVRWTTQQEFTDHGRLGNLLEVRAYNGESEFHAYRSSIGATFYARTRRDDMNELKEDEFMDEQQVLDIGGKRPDAFGYVATGGGQYSLPVPNATHVWLRNYLSYGDDGLASVVDFRIVGLLTKGA